MKVVSDLKSFGHLWFLSDLAKNLDIGLASHTDCMIQLSSGIRQTGNKTPFWQKLSARAPSLGESYST